jgi:SOS-response transcriptional repressor LexA
VIPPGVEPLTSARIRVLAAVVAVHQRDGRATVRTVAEAAGLSSPGTAMRHLRILRRGGWVTWVDHRSGTLRPTIQSVPHGVKP